MQDIVNFDAIKSLKTSKICIYIKIGQNIHLYMQMHNYPKPSYNTVTVFIILF